ncbi:MAG TPA: hypothetical protein VHL09_16905, partial [Dehalococcoidia bacterium]|nr:hypothetical protein [Dehalococcoidia bacterium]
TGTHDAAPALGDLAGKTVGFLDNGKANCHIFFDTLEKVLIEQYGVKSTLRRRKPIVAAAAPAPMLEDLSACDAVIVGMGD